MKRKSARLEEGGKWKETCNKNKIEKVKSKGKNQSDDIGHVKDEFQKGRVCESPSAKPCVNSGLGKLGPIKIIGF